MAFPTHCRWFNALRFVVSCTLNSEEPALSQISRHCETISLEGCHLSSNLMLWRYWIHLEKFWCAVLFLNYVIRSNWRSLQKDKILRPWITKYEMHFMFVTERIKRKKKQKKNKWQNCQFTECAMSYTCNLSHNTKTSQMSCTLFKFFSALILFRKCRTVRPVQYVGISPT